MTAKEEKKRERPKNSERGIVLVLASGGIDSTACIRFYLDQHEEVQALFVNYGQLSAKREQQAVLLISNYYKIPLRSIRCKGSLRKNGGLIHGRNAFLLYLALMEFPATHGFIAIGTHSGTPYYDCSTPFFSSSQKVFDIYTNGAIRIGIPFLNWKKPDILTFCKQRNVPIDLTYSCELGLNQPCGHCNSCLDLEAVHVFT